MTALGRLLPRRLLAGILVVWAAATLTFVVAHVAPGDPVDAVLGPEAAATPELRQQIIKRNGLDQPLLVQYFHRLGELATGDLGRSYQLDQPVSQLLSGQVLPTVELALAGMVTAFALAVAAAVVTAGRGRIARTVASGVELVAASVPAFWLGVVLLSVFSFRWRLFDSVRATGPASLVLPTVALAVPLAGVLAQVIRQELEQAEVRPFALAAQARGIGDIGLLLRHTLRHALMPVTTVSGWVLGSLIGGAVLVENIFARPGLGRILVDAVGSRDIPVVTALVMLSAVAFVVINVLVDLLYLLIDPRLRAEAAP